MSALGHKRTFAVQNGMSALHPIADMCSATRHVRFVPIADIASVDHHFGASEQSRRHSEAEHLCCFKVDCKFEL
jgi:hypothetical protein